MCSSGEDVRIERVDTLPDRDPRYKLISAIVSIARWGYRDYYTQTVRQCRYKVLDRDCQLGYVGQQIYNDNWRKEGEDLALLRAIHRVLSTTAEKHIVEKAKRLKAYQHKPSVVLIRNHSLICIVETIFSTKGVFMYEVSPTYKDENGFYLTPIPDARTRLYLYATRNWTTTGIPRFVQIHCQR